MSFGTVVIGQQNGKLLIQYELIEYLSLEKVATYLGIILFISRSIRIITNYLFMKIYKKIGNKICLLLVLMLILSSILLIVGFNINIDIYIKLLIMTLGFSIFPALREPIKIYSQNIILNTFNKNYQKDTFVYLSLARNIGTFIFSLLASSMLLKLPLQYLFIIFIFSSIPLIIISIKIINSV